MTDQEFRAAVESLGYRVEDAVVPDSHVSWWVINKFGSWVCGVGEWAVFMRNLRSASREEALATLLALALSE